MLSIRKCQLSKYVAKNLQEIEAEEELYYNETFEKEMLELLPAVMTTAVKLTELVVKARLKNGVKLKDHDIYDIYQTAFHKAMVQIPEE